MRIGIIGAGRVGGTLARHFAVAEHDVAVANSRGPETLRELESELFERGRATTAQEAARFGEVVVVAVPFGRYRQVPAQGMDGKPVIDTTNYHPERDGHFPELDEYRTTSSEMMQSHLRGAHVVKAFNAMRWDHLRDFGRPGGPLERFGIPASGDDAHAKRRVLDLIDELGFEPVDAGSLANGGRKHQPGGPFYPAEMGGRELHARLGAP